MRWRVPCSGKKKKEIGSGSVSAYEGLSTQLKATGGDGSMPTLGILRSGE